MFPTLFVVCGACPIFAGNADYVDGASMVHETVIMLQSIQRAGTVWQCTSGSQCTDSTGTKHAVMPLQQYSGTASPSGPTTNSVSSCTSVCWLGNHVQYIAVLHVYIEH